jgi:hypothetical protein
MSDTKKFSLKSLKATSYIYFNPRNHLDEIKLIVETDDKFILPKNDKIDNYANLSKYILRLTNFDFLCKGLTERYVKDALKENHAIVAISSAGIDILPNGNLFGFASVNFEDSDNSLYIDVICSHVGIKYSGDALLKSIKRLCKLLFITKIKLSSVSSAIPFYEKYGFTKVGPCEDKKELCEMVKIVTQKSKTNPSLGGNRIKLKNNRTRKQRSKRNHKTEKYLYR